MFIVYKTTNKINKKFYIGVHCLEAKKSHKTYFGSGKLIKLALKKYGRENFVVETLFEFNDLKSALDKEKEIVNEEFIKDDTNYNLTVGGSSNLNGITNLNGATNLKTDLIYLFSYLPYFPS